MTEVSAPKTFIESLRQLIPCLSPELRKEFGELEKLMEAFQVQKISELSKPILDMQKKFRNSPDGFGLRIQEYLDAQKSGKASESIDSLVAAFKKLTATNIKALGKKFELNIAKKTDADAFQAWLETGVKPPTEEEKNAKEIEQFANEAIQLRDRTVRELSQETMEQILAIADAALKKCKIVGLRAFLEKLDITPSGKTGPMLMKNLKIYLNDLALNRFKAFEND